MTTQETTYDPALHRGVGMTATTDPAVSARIDKLENDVRELRALAQELLAQLRAERDAAATA